jgi:hypothetical protein
MDPFLQQHSGELTILILGAMVLGSLLLLVPQLLKSQLRAMELRHEEHIRTLDQGLQPQRMDDHSVFAGRTAMLVPMVTMCTAGTVTCFLVAYRSEWIFSVTLAVWCVAGVVSLAAITTGVALMGRLAQLHEGIEDEEFTENSKEG